MWGITGRGARLGEGRRSGRTLQVGIARIAVRGPVEHAVLDIAGDLDFSNVRDVVDLVADMPHRIASIDLAGLDFLDGAGARGIELVRDEREHLHDVRPTLVGASRAVERTLRFVRTRDGSLAAR
jgi:anti-anti-sigma regulatory factor